MTTQRLPVPFQANAVAPAAQPSAPSAALPSFTADSYAVDAIADTLDRAYHAGLARYTGGLSPAGLATAYFDWLLHLALSPGKQAQLTHKAGKKLARLAGWLARRASAAGSVEPCIEPLAQDRRFEGPAWGRWPYDYLSQSFLLTQQWWHNATTGVRGVAPHHERVVEFAARQWLDLFSPSNFLLTNPELLEATVAQGGMNLVRGAQHWVEDFQRQLAGKPPAGTETFVIGQDLATTAGKVVYRNHLMELIRYEPRTEKVRPEPVLIVPAWIMKYYILDLSPHNSLVKYLLEQGFSVFVISWRNPGPEDRELGFDAYRRLGVLAALEAVGELAPKARVHGVGYCLGGTLLAIAAAAMARDGEDRLATLSLLAAQVDFEEAGELTLFVDDSQVAFLEDQMWRQGFLDASQMAGAFHLLRSNDLIWSRIQREYFLGERNELIDLMAWNADSTRMPYRMHTEYLRHLFLDNDFAERRFIVDGAPAPVSDITLPVFALGATRDHVAPWKSVHKIHYLSRSDVTFVLVEGGHNGGVVSEPGRKGKRYWLRETPEGARDLDPASWRLTAQPQEGSWWGAWAGWLGERSGELQPPPPLRGLGGQPWAALAPAPGEYVHQR